MPHMKFPHVDISLPKGQVKSPEIDLDTSKGGKITMPDVNVSLPKGKIQGPEMEIEGKGSGFKMQHPKPPSASMGKTDSFEVTVGGTKDNVDELAGSTFKMPKMTMTVSPGKAGVTEGHVELSKPVGLGLGGKGDFEQGIGEIDDNSNGISDKKGKAKLKGTKFNIGMPKKKLHKNVTEADKQDPAASLDRDFGISTPSTTVGKGTDVPEQMKVPRIPDIDFDIGTSPDDEEDIKFKIPPFGVPLPSLTTPEGRFNVYGQDAHYTGPKVPKVKKAVFVLVNPDEAVCPSSKLIKTSEVESITAEMLTRFRKSDQELPEGMESSTGERRSGTQVLLPSSKTGLFEVTTVQESVHVTTTQKGDISGRMKLPKVEVTSPHGQIHPTQDVLNLLGKQGGQSSLACKFSTDQGSESTTDAVKLSKEVRSHMLDSGSSEFPSRFTVQSWTERESRSPESGFEEKEATLWSRVPKFTLKPHSTGFLQITPEGSPQAQRRGEVGGEQDVPGSFCFHSSGLSSQDPCEELHSTSFSTGPLSDRIHSTSTTSTEQQEVTTAGGTRTLLTTTTTVTRHTTHPHSHSPDPSGASGWTESRH